LKVVEIGQSGHFFNQEKLPASLTDSSTASRAATPFVNISTTIAT
jgi:hypothetical protein